MNKTISLLIWILALVQMACTFNKSEEADKSTKLTNVKKGIEILRFPETGEDTLKTSYFADTIIYVPLETTSKSLIKRSNQIWMNDSIILINDNQKF